MIETARLALRLHTEADFPDSLAMWSDPGVTRFIGGRPFTSEEVWARLLRYAGHWAWSGFGFWVLCDKSSGRFMGEVGFATYRRGLGPDFDDRPEIGWVLAPWSHGQGFASEAARALVAWGEAQWPGQPTVCMIEVGHTASLNVAAKIGYTEMRRAHYKDKQVVLLSR